MLFLAQFSVTRLYHSNYHLMVIGWSCLYNKLRKQNNLLGVVMGFNVGWVNRVLLQVGLLIKLLRINRLQKSFITASSNPTMKFPIKKNLHIWRKFDRCFYSMPQYIYLCCTCPDCKNNLSATFALSNLFLHRSLQLMDFRNIFSWNIFLNK